MMWMTLIYSTNYSHCVKSTLQGYSSMSHIHVYMQTSIDHRKTNANQHWPSQDKRKPAIRVL